MINRSSTQPRISAQLRNFHTIFALLLLTLCLITSCGRKSELQRPKDYQRPNFDGYSDEIDYPAKKNAPASQKTR